MYRLLIVDDDGYCQDVLTDALESEEYELCKADDGLDALEMVQQNPPDLVLLDIDMPKMDGVSALRQMMQNDPRARVVMVSAVNQKEKLAECIQAGAIDFIVKPFEKASLRSFFDKYFNDESPQVGNVR